MCTTTIASISAGDKLRDAMLHRISAISRLRLVTSSLWKIA
jgi:hypothetical protein